MDLPLLERAYDLHAEIVTRFPADWDNGLGQMGLLLFGQLATGEYWCTPTNSLSFGTTGGDGAHFSFLLSDNAITDRTPVIISVPDNFGSPKCANVVLGRGFEDFVRLGLHCGYFAMAQFAFDAKNALKHYARTDWEYVDTWGASDQHKIVAEFAAKYLRLTSLAYTPDQFEALQAEFAPLMQFKPNT